MVHEWPSGYPRERGPPTELITFLHSVNMAALCALLIVGLAIFLPSLGSKGILGVSFVISFVFWMLSVYWDIEAWEKGERTDAESIEIMIRAMARTG